MPQKHIQQYEELLGSLAHRYCKNREQMEWLGFHGTNKAHIENMVENGINPNYCKRTAYGDGVYFSSFARTAAYYSHTATGTNQVDNKVKHMLLCQLIAANPKKLIFPHEWKNGANASHFDSYLVTKYDEPVHAKDMIGNAEEICVKYPFQAIPTHVYEFQKIAPARVKRRV